MPKCPTCGQTIGRRDPATTAQKLYEMWLKAGYEGEWPKKEWVQASRGVSMCHSEERALSSFAGFLEERGEFYSGHYPSKWAREPARWAKRMTPVGEVPKMSPEELFKKLTGKSVEEAR